MNFTCLKQELLEAINIVKLSISTKPTLSILEGILIQTSEDLQTIKLLGTDLDIGIEYTIDAKVKSHGSIVVDARLFSEIIRNFGDSEIFFDLKENTIINLECENSKFEIKGTSADAYPSVTANFVQNDIINDDENKEQLDNDTTKENKYVKINQKILKDMINQTIFAVSNDENRKILTGSLIECSNKEITIVSLDNKKMAIRRNELENNFDLKVVVPGKTLKEISKIIQSSENDVEIFINNNQILFQLEKCRISARLLEGEFFNYNSIISKDFETSVIVDRKMLYDAVKRASLVTLEENRYPISIDVKDDIVIVKSNSNIGTVEDQINAEIEGKNMSISFNPFYMLETLNSIDDRKVNIIFVTELGPCIIKPVIGQSYTYLIASVRK